MAISHLQGTRLAQAREALEEARALIASGMDGSIVLTNVYYAFYYPVIALVYEGTVPETMQSVTLGLFEQRFIRNGSLPREYADSLRRLFEIKPKCGCEKQTVSREQLDAFIAQAERFISLVEQFIQR